jgi:hypothetical protein
MPQLATSTRRAAWALAVAALATPAVAAACRRAPKVAVAASPSAPLPAATDTAIRSAAPGADSAAQPPLRFLPPGTIVPPGQPVDAPPAPYDPARDGPLRPAPSAGPPPQLDPRAALAPRDLASLALAHGTQYRLVRYGGRPMEPWPRVSPRAAARVPAYRRAGRCPAVVSSGSLLLDSAGGQFAFGYEVRDACTEVVLGRALTTGRYDGRGPDLVFGVVGDGRQFDPGRDAPVTASFTGRRTAAGIALRPPADAAMLFR